LVDKQKVGSHATGRLNTRLMMSLGANGASPQQCCPPVCPVYPRDAVCTPEMQSTSSYNAACAPPLPDLCRMKAVTLAMMMGLFA
jgi:hypothetical protein